MLLVKDLDVSTATKPVFQILNLLFLTIWNINFPAETFIFKLSLVFSIGFIILEPFLDFFLGVFITPSFPRAIRI